MRVPLLAAALLLGSLGACGSGAQDAAPAGETATEATVLPETPSEDPGTDAAPTATASQGDDAACGADKLARWLNVLPTDDVKAEIAAAVGDRPIRYYGPNDAVTMDYNPERLNAELGADGRIKRFRCG